MQGFALRGLCAEQTTVQGAWRLQQKLAEHPRVDLLHHGVPPGALGQHSPSPVTISSSPGALGEPGRAPTLLTQHKSQTPCLPWAHPCPQPGGLLQKRAQGAWDKSSDHATCWRLGQHLKKTQLFSSFIFFDKQ